MISNVYYLKYRPQVLDELVGQQAVKKTLLASFTNNKLAHAYLLVGPRGTGKTSTARILAKMVNCSAEQNTPCNKCETCRSITDGSNLDLIEIDAASNRGIEDIRSLRDKIKLAPSSSRKKVYIIDEVHMLTPEAFNALLKTLEEPPAHALFILATTEIAKVPPTILSRVQRLDFKLAKETELLEALSRIVKKEKIEIDEEALKILAKKSDGSFRDGVKLLDQIASMGEKITAKLVNESLQSSQFGNILDLIQTLKNKNAAEGLLAISRQIENGAAVKQLISALMDAFRSLVLIKNGVGEELVKVHLTEDQYQQLVSVSENLSGHDLVRSLDILQTALEKLKFASIPSLPLELAVVEICGEEIKTISQEPAIKGAKPLEPTLTDVETLVSMPESETVSPALPIKSSAVSSNSNSADILKLKEKWTFVLETIRAANFSLEALLRSIKIADCTDKAVIMEVPYAFHQRILEAPKNRDLLESIFSDILGRGIKISTILGKHPHKRADIANIEVAQDDEIIRAAAEIFNSDSVN